MEEFKQVDAAFCMSGLALLVSTAASILLIMLQTSQAPVTEVAAGEGKTGEGKAEEGKGEEGMEEEDKEGEERKGTDARKSHERTYGRFLNLLALSNDCVVSDKKGSADFGV